MIAEEMKELLQRLADLAAQVSDEVYDDDNENGTMGILRTCDQLLEKIDSYLGNKQKGALSDESKIYW